MSLRLHSVPHIVIISLTVALFLNKVGISFSQEIKNNQNSQKLMSESNVTAATENVSRYNRHLEWDIDKKFRINANTIIRAGESRVLGATYLNETSLSSNRECLKWCLETPKCNAVVYEEKNMQSCYMFDCGPPSNFLCKFTAHSFFMSSILKISQHSYELSQWGKQEKHERELADLRNSEVSISSSTTSSTDSTVTVISTVSSALERSGKPGSKCHHYQFQCLNNSECIAIYNVCDGIPQCPDGSDESIELKCPKGIDETPPEPERPSELPGLPENKVSSQNVGSQLPRPSTTLKSPQKAQNFQSGNKQKSQEQKEEKQNSVGTKMNWPNRLPEDQISRSEYYHHIDDSDGLGSPFVHKHSQFVAANDPHVQNLKNWVNDYDQYPQHPAAVDQQYPYDSNFQRLDDQYAPNQLSPEYDAVKGYGGYRQEDIPYWPNQDIMQDGAYPVDELPQTGLHTLSKQNNFPEKDNIYAQQLARTAEQFPEAKHHIIHKPMDIMPPAQQNGPSEIEDYKLRRFPLQNQRPYLSYDESLPRKISNFPDMKSKAFDSSQNVEDNLYNNDDLIRASIVSQLPMQGEQAHYMHGHDMKHMEKTTASHTSSKESKDGVKDDSLIIVKPTSHSKPVQKTVLDFKMSVTELYQSNTVHSREANSAILALVLGLIVTFLLSILIACRMKTFRRRISRKGRGLAHDADYLVNGMYL